jgi:hypothetical protein
MNWQKEQALKGSRFTVHCSPFTVGGSRFAFHLLRSMAGLLRVLRTGSIGLMGLMGRVVHRQDYCERWTPNWQMWTPIEDDDEDSLPRRRLGEGGRTR